MSLTTDEDSLWNSSVCNKSWVELCEDDDEEFSRLNHSSASQLLQQPTPNHVSPTLNNGSQYVKPAPQQSTLSPNHHYRISDKLKQQPKENNFAGKIIKEEPAEVMNSTTLASPKLVINNLIPTKDVKLKTECVKSGPKPNNFTGLIVKSEPVDAVEKPILASSTLSLGKAVSVKDITSADKIKAEKMDNAACPIASINSDSKSNNFSGVIVKSEPVNAMDEAILASPKLSLVETVSVKDIKQEVGSPNFSMSYANMLKSSPVKGSNTIHGVKSSTKETPRKEIMKEIGKNIHQDDMSLTSHLDLFQLGSPCKSEGGESRKRSMLNSCSGSNSGLTTPTKEERDIKVAVRRMTRSAFSALQDEDTIMPDTMLLPSPRKLQSDELMMPSPSKLARKVSVTPKLETGDNCRKRQREHTPASKGKKRETSPSTLARRQKQIDYGKNTIGYQRYRQQVPINNRDRRHPQTPPKHVKYSRRAWDGLVKAWRQRLHFWDPPSEGGGDPETLEVEESEVELSSCDSSICNTPRQEWRRRVRPKRDSSSCTEEDVDVDMGCQQLV